MQTSACPHVSPLLANIDIQAGEDFDSADLTKYSYEMVGGNHSREVFQSLLEQPLYQMHKSFNCRLAAVYKNLSDKEALALGRQHNLTSETHLQSKFYDDVKLTRRLFSAIKKPVENELLEFNDKMKEIFIQVFRIDLFMFKHRLDNIILFRNWKRRVKKK